VQVVMTKTGALRLILRLDGGCDNYGRFMSAFMHLFPMNQGMNDSCGRQRRRRGCLETDQIRNNSPRRVGRNRPLEEGAVAGLAEDLALFGDHLAAQDRHHRPAGHREALVGRVVGAVVHQFLADHFLALFVPQHEVGIEPDRDRFDGSMSQGDRCRLIF